MRNDDDDRPAGDKWEDCGFTLHGDSGGLRPSSNRDKLNDILSKIEILSESEKTGSTEQPYVQDGYWQSLEEAVTGASKNGLRKRTDLPVEAPTLEDLIPKALVAFNQVFDAKLDPADPQLHEAVIR